MINTSLDHDGIACIEWDMPGHAPNLLNHVSMAAFDAAIRKTLADPAVKGILLASAKPDFIAGGDLDMLMQASDAQALFDRTMGWHQLLRTMETGGKPVAVAFNGSALGGGLELALACHYRVAADHPKARFGFPEVTLGLLPGAGGTQRLPRLLGMQASLPLLLEGKRIKAQEAKKANLIHDVVPVGEERSAARSWLIGSIQSGVKPQQPWDGKGFRVPGGGPMTPTGLQLFTGANAMLREKTYGNYPAPRHILSCIFEGLQTDIGTGLKIEARYFVNLVLSPAARNMIRSLFFGMNEANKLDNRPPGVPTQAYAKIGMLGAGMMGAGIAHAAAMAGMEVVLLDTSQETADQGKNYSHQLLARQVAKGHITQGAADAVLTRIQPTAAYDQLQGCQLVIEAVFEDRAIKADVTRKAEAALTASGVADAIFATNTSTLPIGGLAQASAQPTNFIGLHFFSPAERMPLVEIIAGQQTSQTTLARAMDFVKAIGKTPIVVNDSRGFYTSRVFGSYIAEGMALLSEGVSPALIDKAGLIAGMLVGPLALTDEVSIELVYKVARQAQADLGEAYVAPPSAPVVTLMVEQLGRLGKKVGKGFYDYPADAKKRLWPGLAEHFPLRNEQPGVDEVVERLILVQSLETARCLEEKVLMRAQDADVGAILGWGYPPFRGGPIGWIHTLGIANFISDCERLAARHGPRFAPPQILRDMAAQGERFYPL